MVSRKLTWVCIGDIPYGYIGDTAIRLSGTLFRVYRGYSRLSYRGHLYCGIGDIPDEVVRSVPDSFIRDIPDNPDI